jgi:HTH-type transcriptional regulator/antitoxin HigA
MGAVLNDAKYHRLLAKASPRLIRSKREYRRALGVLHELHFPERKLSPEEKTIERLVSHLIAEYENRTAPVPEAPPLDVLRFLMDSHGLRQADLIPAFGSRSVASAVVNGKRGISKTHAKRLAEKFHVETGVFL